jgi:hypothetical protein
MANKAYTRELTTANTWYRAWPDDTTPPQGAASLVIRASVGTWLHVAPNTTAPSFTPAAGQDNHWIVAEQATYFRADPRCVFVRNATALSTVSVLSDW